MPRHLSPSRFEEREHLRMISSFQCLRGEENAGMDIRGGFGVLTGPPSAKAGAVPIKSAVWRQ